MFRSKKCLFVQNRCLRPFFVDVDEPFCGSSVALAHLNPIALVRHRAGPSHHAEGHESGRGCWASASAHDPGVKQPRQAAHAPARGSAVSASVQ